MRCNGDHIMNHLNDGSYREHEIITAQCTGCKQFIVDVRSDAYDGEMLAGFIDTDLVQAMMNAFKAVDKHELDKILLINVPF